MLTQENKIARVGCMSASKFYGLYVLGEGHRICTDIARERLTGEMAQHPPNAAMRYGARNEASVLANIQVAADDENPVIGNTNFYRFDWRRGGRLEAQTGATPDAMRGRKTLEIKSPTTAEKYEWQVSVARTVLADLMGTHPSSHRFVRGYIWQSLFQIWVMKNLGLADNEGELIFGKPDSDRIEIFAITLTPARTQIIEKQYWTPSGTSSI